MRGAYFTSKGADKSTEIDFFVLDPSHRVVYSRRRTKEGLFRFTAKTEGIYAFVFSNVKYSNIKDVTMAVHIDDPATPKP